MEVHWPSVLLVFVQLYPEGHSDQADEELRAEEETDEGAQRKQLPPHVVSPQDAPEYRKSHSGICMEMHWPSVLLAFVQLYPEEHHDHADEEEPAGHRKQSASQKLLPHVPLYSGSEHRGKSAQMHSPPDNWIGHV
jgi:hypothetical protein